MTFVTGLFMDHVVDKGGRLLQETHVARTKSMYATLNPDKRRMLSGRVNPSNGPDYLEVLDILRDCGYDRHGQVLCTGSDHNGIAGIKVMPEEDDE